MVTHRLREGEDLAAILIAGGNAPAAPGDQIYRKMNDGSYQIQAVDATGAIVTILAISQAAMSLLPRLSETDGVLALDGQKIPGLTAEDQAIISSMLENISDLTEDTSGFGDRLTAVEQTVTGTPPAPVYAYTITPGALPDVAAITSIVEGTTFAQILAQVTDPGGASVTGGGEARVFLSVISDTGNDPVEPDDRIMGIQQTFAYPGAETIVREEIAALNIAVAAGSFEILREATTDGLTGLTTEMTPQDAEAAWVGQPIARATNGAGVFYSYDFLHDGGTFDKASAFVAGEFFIEVRLSAEFGESVVVSDPIVIGPFTVAEAEVIAGDPALATITGTGPQLQEFVVAATPPGYQRNVVTRTEYIASNGAVVSIAQTLIRINGEIISAASAFDEAARLKVDETIQIGDTLSAAGANTRTIWGDIRAAVAPRIIIREEATVGTIAAGLTVAQTLEKVNRGISISTSGRDVFVSVSVMQDGASFSGAVTKAGSTLTFTVTRTSQYAEESPPSILTATVAAAVVTGPAIPDATPTGGFTLAQVEALRTDGTTRGVTIGTAFKKPGTDALPAGLSRSGTRITVNSGADIALIDGWDFAGHDWTVKGRVRAFTNCVFGYPTDLGLTLFDLYPESHIDKFSRCSFLGAGYYGNTTGKPALRTRLASSGVDGPQVDLIERCDFFGWGSDIIKSSWGGKIRLCYFDSPMNLPSGTEPWSSARNYAVGQWVTSADGKYAYSALVAGSGNALPSAKASNTNWKNQDPHVDHINPYYQFDEKLLIEACYINRLEGTRAINPGKHLAIGVNNGIRATRNTGADKPINTIEIANVIVSKSDNNESYPFELENLTEINVGVSILRDSWIGKTKGGSFVHPSGEAGHTITNLVDYSQPSTPTAGYGQAGTPSAGTGGGTTDPGTGGGTTTPTNPMDITLDNSKTAVFTSAAQSEQASASRKGTVASRVPYPFVPADTKFDLFIYDGVFHNAGAPYRVNLTNANKSDMNISMVYLALALRYAAPGKPFAMGSADESGSGRISLFNDGTFGDSNGQNRKWSVTKACFDLLRSVYPQGPSRHSEMWYAADISFIDTFLKDFSPMYFRQHENGAAYTLGTVNTANYRKQTVDHSYWNMNLTDRNARGDALFSQNVALDVIQKPDWGGSTNPDTGTHAGMQALSEDSRFKSLGNGDGMYGFPSCSWLGDLEVGPTDDRGHPSDRHHYGFIEAAYQFWMPTALKAAGYPITPPRFIGLYTAGDGSYSEMNLYAPNGGTLASNYLVRGSKGTLPSVSSAYGPTSSSQLNTTTPFYQEIYGVMISRKSGGGLYPIVQPNSTGIDRRYWGKVTRRNGKAHIVMTDPIQPGDEFCYGAPRMTWRQDYPKNGFTWNGCHLTGAIEYVAKFSDPSSDFPFAGFPVKQHSPKWAAVRGAYVGEGTPEVIAPPAATEPDPVEPTSPPPTTTGDYWITASSGPQLAGTSNISSGTTKLRFVTDIYIPSSITSVAPSLRVYSISAQVLDMVFWISSDGGPRFELGAVRDSANNSVTPNTKTLHSFPFDTKVSIEVIADYTARTVTSKMAGQPDIVRSFSADTGDGTAQAGRTPIFNGTTTSSTKLPAGVRVYGHKVYANDSTTPFMDVPNTAAEVNSSPMLVAGTGTATGPEG